MEEKKEIVTTRYNEMSVVTQTHGEIDKLRMFRGRAVVDTTYNSTIIIENAPRGPRSSEVWRTLHGRVVRRPDGLYTLTVRFSAAEKYIQPALVAEVREVVNVVIEDYVMQQCKMKGGLK